MQNRFAKKTKPSIENYFDFLWKETDDEKNQRSDRDLGIIKENYPVLRRHRPFGE